MMFHEGPYMVGMHVFWWLFWVLPIAVILIAVIWFAAGASARRGDWRGRESPHAVLRRRLAAGEITPEAYEQTKALLDRDK